MAMALKLKILNLHLVFLVLGIILNKVNYFQESQHIIVDLWRSLDQMLWLWIRMEQRSELLAATTLGLPSPITLTASSSSRCFSFSGFMWEFLEISVKGIGKTLEMQPPFNIQSLNKIQIDFCPQFSFQTIGWFLSSVVWTALRPGAMIR